MIAIPSAVSLSAVPASTSSKSGSKPPKTGWAFQPLPNLNRETRQAIGRRKAGWTFAVICTELGYAVHRGKATWDKQRLGIGLRAVARESGQSIGKVRRDVAALADLGLVVIHRPNVMHVRDQESGRIVRKVNGRCESTLLYLTITPAVLRPAKVHRDTTTGGTGGTSVAPPPADPKVHPDTTVRDSLLQRTPAGLAVGIGQPPATAAQEGRLTAAGTGTATDTTGTPTGLPDASQGRLTAAGAGGGLTAATGAGRLPAAVQEEGSDFLRRVTADPESDGLELPADRIVPRRDDPDAARRRAAIERRDRLAADYAYHLGLTPAAVVELWKSDRHELRRRLIEAGVDPETGRPRRRSSQPSDHGEPVRHWNQRDAHSAIVKACRAWQRDLAADFIPDELDAAGTGVGAAESVPPDA